MGEEVAGAELHARAAPALPREGAPVPRRLRADARQSSFDVRPADDRAGDRAQPGRRRLRSRTLANAEVLDAIADPDYQTELGAVQHRAQRAAAAAARRLGARARGRAARQPQRTPRPQANEIGAHIVAIGILPTLMPEHFEDRVDERQPPLRRAQRGGLRRPRRGLYLDIEGPDGRAAGDVRRHHRPGVRLHLGAAAPAGRPRRTSPPTGTPRRRWSARSWRWAPTRRSSSASGCGPRPASSCSCRPPTPARSS